MFVKCRNFLSSCGSIQRLTFSQRITTSQRSQRSICLGSQSLDHTHTHKYFLRVTVVTGDYNLQPWEPFQKQAKQMSATFTMTITTIKNKLKWVFLESQDAENISRQNHKFPRRVLKPHQPRTLNNSQTRLSNRISIQISTSQWKSKMLFFFHVQRKEQPRLTNNNAVSLWFGPAHRELDF